MNESVFSALNKPLVTAPITIPPSVFWGIFGIALGVFVFVAVVLLYHWSRYGYKSGVIKAARIIFVLGGAVLFVNAAVSILLAT